MSLTSPQVGWGLLGAILFEGDQAAYANTRAADHPHSSEKDATFRRRLEEARAFGRASNALSSISPELSARYGLSVGQRFAAIAMLGAIGYLVFTDPLTTWYAFANALSVVFGLVILLRLMAAVAARLPGKATAQTDISDDDLPTLSILIPLYREDVVVAALIEAIGRLNYPIRKLEVKLLIEADDDLTLEATERARPPPWFEIIPVPPGDPRAKPTALNYGMTFATGELIAVFDAEDRPSPDQPRAAAAAFLRGPGNLAVVQAPLLIHNGHDSWFSAQFEVEYAIHFRTWLPFLARLRVPLPLGGTSNYFKRDRLEKAGRWDAWNVTEDADLGFRLARFGGEAAMISEPTWEEAPSHLKTWTNQRTRWMKGHLQTWIVLTRQPLAVMRGMGLRNFLAVLVTMGGSLLASIMHLPLFVILGLWLFTPYVSLEGWHAALFGFGYFSALAAAWAARATRATFWTLFTVPLYWPLLSWAMLRALFELNIRPHFWAKTPHGAARRRP